MEVNLTDMWRRLRKSFGLPLIETPKTEIILPVKSTGVITGIDMGEGKSTSVIMVAGPKRGPRPIQLSPKKLQTKWKLSNEMFAPQEPHKTIEEALRRRHVPSKRVNAPYPLEQGIMKALTDSVVKDIEDLMINGPPTSGDDITIDSITGSPYAVAPPKTKYLVNPNNFVYMGGASLLNKPRKIGFKYPTVAEALRKRHHKERTGVETIEQPLYSAKDIKVMPLPRLKTKLFTDQIDKLWVK